MNPAQRKLFKDAKCYKVDLEGENAKHWKELIRVTTSRQMMFDYLTDLRARNYHYVNYPYCWNVKCYPDLDLEDFRKYLAEGSNCSYDVQDAEKRGFVEKAYNKYKDSLWSWGIEDAVDGVMNSDCYRFTRFSDQIHDFEATFVGRSGGYFALTKINGFEVTGRYMSDVQESLEGYFNSLSRQELFKLCMLFVELGACMTSKAAEEEVQYQAFNRLDQKIQEMYEDNMVGDWEVIKVDKPEGYYRVRNKVTQEESMLGTEQECQEIVKLAEAGELLGSFGLKKR